MKIYIINLEESFSGIYNDFILKVFDSEEKAIKFCESISGVVKGDYVVQDLSKLDPYRGTIGYVMDSAEYEVYIIERDIE